MTVDRYADVTTVRSDVRDAAEEATDSLDSLISPSDLIHSNADEWSEVTEDDLTEEIAESVSVMRSEGQRPHAGLAHDLALALCRDSLTRVPLSDLTFDDRQAAVREGYWPYDMNRTEVTERIEETHVSDGTVLWRQCETEAWDAVTAGIHDGLIPDVCRDD